MLHYHYDQKPLQLPANREQRLKQRSGTKLINKRSNTAGVDNYRVLTYVPFLVHRRKAPAVATITVQQPHVDAELIDREKCTCPFGSLKR